MPAGPRAAALIHRKQRYTTVAYALLHTIYRCLPDRPVYKHSQPKGASEQAITKAPLHASASGRDEEAGAMRHVRYGYFHSSLHAVHCASNNGLGLVPLKGNEVVVAVTLVVTTKFCKFYL
jgi:hypothetical protein